MCCGLLCEAASQHLLSGDCTSLQVSVLLLVGTARALRPPHRICGADPLAVIHCSNASYCCSHYRMPSRILPHAYYVKGPFFKVLLLLYINIQAGVLASEGGSAQNSVHSSSQWVFIESSATSKPGCCFFCDSEAGCYDQLNHQRRHNLYFLVQALASDSNRPPAYCVPGVACTEKGSPFKTLAATVTESENYYTITASDDEDGVSYSRFSATVSENSVVGIKDGASVQLASGQVLLKSSWLDVLQSTLSLQRVLLRGQLNLLYLSTGTLMMNRVALNLKDSPVLINEGSIISAQYANITFANSPDNDPEANPLPFIMSGSSVSLQQASINFVNHQDVFFDSCSVKMHAATFRAVNSNIRFFDSVLDLQGTTTILDNSQIWLFNTTLIRDKTVSVVVGDVPVKLNDVLWGKPIATKTTSGKVLIRSS